MTTSTRALLKKTKLITTAKRKLGLLHHIKYWTTPQQLNIIANSVFNGPVMYGAQSWSTANPVLVEHIEKIREKAARMSAGVHRVRFSSRVQVARLLILCQIEVAH